MEDGELCLSNTGSFFASDDADKPGSKGNKYSKY